MASAASRNPTQASSRSDLFILSVQLTRSVWSAAARHRFGIFQDLGIDKDDQSGVGPPHPNGSLPEKAETLEQAVEPGIASELVESGVGRDIDHAFCAFLISLVEKLERSFLLSHAGVNQRQKKR